MEQIEQLFWIMCKSIKNAALIHACNLRTNIQTNPSVVHWPQFHVCIHLLITLHRVHFPHGIIEVTKCEFSKWSTCIHVFFEYFIYSVSPMTFLIYKIDKCLKSHCKQTMKKKLAKYLQSNCVVHFWKRLISLR